MLTKDGIIARYIFAFCLFLMSGTEAVTGSIAAWFGVLGTIELTTALLRYSPLVVLIEILNRKYKLNRFWHASRSN